MNTTDTTNPATFRALLYSVFGCIAFRATLVFTVATACGCSTIHDWWREIRRGGDAPQPAVPAIAWKWGGFDGAGAVEDPNTQIADLRTNERGMTYRWATGSLRNWGLADGDAGALACAFYWDGINWIGGKFEWISTSRTSREWTNIRGGYRGWQAEPFFSATRRAFCIASKDGRRRTNIIEETRQ